MPFLNETMLATMCVVEMFEMSKHSMTIGRCGNWSASPSALRSATGLIVDGSEWRVNRRVGAVVRRRSSIMSRNSAAFSKFIFAAAAFICSSNSARVLARAAFEELARGHHPRAVVVPAKFSARTARGIS